jgi:transcriptional regulator with XRE-family HTH domain
MAELGERLSCSRQYVSDVERGRCEPSVSTLVEFARALGVLPSVLLSEALQEEWSGWWGPVLDELEDVTPASGPLSDYDLGVAAGYSDALLDASEALDRHVLAWRKDVWTGDCLPSS